MSSTGALVYENLTWTGEQSGSLGLAAAACEAGQHPSYRFTDPSGQRYLVIALPTPLGPGSYSVGPSEVVLYLGDRVGPGINTLYLSDTGTLKMDVGGHSGSVDAQLSPQGQNGQSTGIHLIGNWTCS